MDQVPFISTDDATFTALESWPPKWRAPNLVMLDRTTTQKRKDEAKLCIMQLAEKRHNEKVAAEVRAVLEVAQATTDQEKVAKVAVEAQKIGATTTQVEEGQEFSIGQEVEGIDLAK